MNQRHRLAAGLALLACASAPWLACAGASHTGRGEAHAERQEAPDPSATTRSVAAAGDDASAGVDGAAERLAAFFTAHQHEVDRHLSAPSQLFVAHPQRPLPGFVPLGKRPPPTQGVAKLVHHARMYAFNHALDCDDAVVTADGTLCESAVYPGAPLSAPQLAAAVAIADTVWRDRAGWDERAYVRCYEPHHAVVLYDAAGRPLAELTPCFMCGNLRITPGPSGERAMPDAEARFFADTCRALGVGGCPPEGTSRMPDAPPRAQSRDARRAELIGRPHGVDGDRALTATSATERAILCNWVDAPLRFGPGAAFECKDGRQIMLPACAEASVRPCSATVSDFAECTRARLAEKLCGVDPPSCSRADACKFAAYRR